MILMLTIIITTIIINIIIIIIMITTIIIFVITAFSQVGTSFASPGVLWRYQLSYPVRGYVYVDVVVIIPYLGWLRRQYDFDILNFILVIIPYLGWLRRQYELDILNYHYRIYILNVSHVLT